MGERAQRTSLPPPTQQPYVPYVEQYVNRCFVDKEVLEESGAAVMRGYFLNADGEQVCVHVPTESFFVLHQDQQAMDLWDRMNLQGFFQLPPWGPDLRRAWEAYSTFTQKFTCTVTDFHGHVRELHITTGIVREALGITQGDISFDKLKHSDEENATCSPEVRPSWDDLLHQEIRLATQLHMQHFHMTYPHRYTKPEKRIATEYTLRQEQGSSIKYDYALHLLIELSNGVKSVVTQRKSHAKRPHPLYLGAALVITRIIYRALNKLDQLPDPWVMPPDAKITIKPSKYTKEQDADMKRRKKEKRKRRKEKEQAPEGSPKKHATRQRGALSSSSDSDDNNHGQWQEDTAGSMPDTQEVPESQTMPEDLKEDLKKIRKMEEAEAIRKAEEAKGAGSSSRRRGEEEEDAELTEAIKQSLEKARKRDALNKLMFDQTMMQQLLQEREETKEEPEVWVTEGVETEPPQLQMQIIATVMSYNQDTRAQQELKEAFQRQQKQREKEQELRDKETEWQKALDRLHKRECLEKEKSKKKGKAPKFPELTTNRAADSSPTHGYKEFVEIARHLVPKEAAEVAAATAQTILKTAEEEPPQDIASEYQETFMQTLRSLVRLNTLASRQSYVDQVQHLQGQRNLQSTKEQLQEKADQLQGLNQEVEAIKSAQKAAEEEMRLYKEELFLSLQANIEYKAKANREQWVIRRQLNAANAREREAQVLLQEKEQQCKDHLQQLQESKDRLQVLQDMEDMLLKDLKRVTEEKEALNSQIIAMSATTEKAETVASQGELKKATPSCRKGRST